MSGNKKSNGTDGEGKVKQLGEVLTEKSRTCNDTQNKEMAWRRERKRDGGNKRDRIKREKQIASEHRRTGTFTVWAKRSLIKVERIQGNLT